MRNSPIAAALAAAVLESDIDPKEFLRRQRQPPYQPDTGPKQIGEFSLEDIGIDHSQYFGGRGTSYTDWDAVYVGVGDNPHESISDALEAAAMDGWQGVDAIDITAFPETPSASGECERQAAAERGDDEEADDDFGMECELYYYTAVWLKRKGAETAESIITSVTEGRYLDKLAWIKRARQKNQAMKDLAHSRKEIEDIDKPDKKKKRMNLH